MNLLWIKCKQKYILNQSRLRLVSYSGLFGCLTFVVDWSMADRRATMNQNLAAIRQNFEQQNGSISAELHNMSVALCNEVRFKVPTDVLNWILQIYHEVQCIKTRRNIERKKQIAASIGSENADNFGFVRRKHVVVVVRQLYA